MKLMKLVLSAAICLHVNFAGIPASADANDAQGCIHAIHILEAKSESQAAATINSYTAAQTYFQAMCLGAIRAIFFFQKELKLCIPDGIKPNDVLRITIREIENRPEIWKLDIHFLIAGFVQKEWPCPGS